MSALDDLKEISRTNDNDKIARLEARIDEVEDRASKIGQAAGKAIQKCTEEIAHLKMKVVALQNKPINVNASAETGEFQKSDFKIDNHGDVEKQNVAKSIEETK